MSSKPVRARIEKQPIAFPYPDIENCIPGAPSAACGGVQQGEEREAAYHAGLQEGEARAKAGFQAELAEMKSSIAAVIDKFARDQREYFVTVEREVVQLACSITRKILRRESTLDPLLLAGMVRVALERISQATRVTVRVNAQQVSDFRVFFARTMQENPPEVIEDAGIEPDRCILQTELGTSEIGPEVQLKEIEQGLLDLQAAKPRTER